MDRYNPTPAVTEGASLQDYIEHAKAPITRQCYRRDWTHFLGWCSGRGLTPIPAEPGTVALYLSEMAEVKLKGLAPGFGLDPKEVGGHSLRAGFITDQYAAGTAEAIIMDRSRHRSHAVMSVYRREASLFAFNYTVAAGL